MISVAMSTYNGEKYIYQQLESIFNQTRQPDEVIICDDCSIDNTVAIINQYIKDNKLGYKCKLYINESNLGYINNFKKSMSLTTGNYIFLADQDDIYYENKYEVMCNYLNNKNVLVVNANYEMIDENSNIIKGIRFRSTNRSNGINKMSFESFLYNSNYPGFSMGMKRELLEEFLKLDFADCYGHDILLNLLAIHLDGAYEINNILSKYRLHSNNTSGCGNVSKTIEINSRLMQKEKEKEEYLKLINIINTNHFNFDINVIKKRIETLDKRLKAIRNKNIFILFLLFFFNTCYPKKTILGDIYYIIKGG